MATVQAMARHRLARVPYVGVPRAVVEARVQRGPHAQARDEGAWVHTAQEIYLDLARYHAAGGVDMRD